MKIINSIFCFFVLSLFIVSCSDTEPMVTEELPKISISSVTKFEGDVNSNFDFIINMNKSSDKTVSVNYQTQEVNAGAGTDFIAASGTINLSPGEQMATISIEIIADTWKEGDEEFRVVLSNPTNATLVTSEGIGTIRNEDTDVMTSEDGYITPDNYPGLELVWADEFDADCLNLADWTHEQGNSGWGNNELQYYTDRKENSFLQNGNLIIEAKEESFGSANYTSARLVTLNKQSHAFGRIDIRAILPEGQGIWPALWMLGSDFQTIGWPACGEIDIMELVGHQPSMTKGTAHWGPQGQSSSFSDGEYFNLTGGAKFSDEYHVFSLVWEPNKIEWYVNDNKFFTLTPETVNGNYPFNQDFFFIFNIAVGGNWPGSPNNTTVFPQRMIVDYVRVFQ